MALYRCYNCDNAGGQPGRDFEAEKPVCPECGAEGTQETSERTGSVVVRVETIHFHPPSKVKGKGVGYLACKPDDRFPPNTPNPEFLQATGEVALVNCHLCRKSGLFRARAEAMGLAIEPRESEFRLEPEHAVKES